MVFVAGIDEAGYGPLLGPLVVGYSLFRVPEVDADLWKALHYAVSPKPKRRDRRIQVNDSKVVNTGKYGRDRLERGIAAFRSLLFERETLFDHSRDFKQWLNDPPSTPSKWWDAAPWFRQLDGALCPSMNRERIGLDRALLNRHQQKAGVQVVGLGARAVPAAELNLLSQKHGSKGGALFKVNLEILQHLLQISGDAPLRVEFDRHGGRSHYAQKLKQALDPDKLWIHKEGSSVSSYTLQFEHRKVEIRFSESADVRYFAVSLASMAAKLTRERLMDFWNAWFGERLGEAVKSTKGYALDAKRWLVEAEPHLREMQLDMELLRRRR